MEGYRPGRPKALTEQQTKELGDILAGWRRLANTKWECKYHMLLMPKYRHKVLFGKSRKRIGEILRELCRYKGIELLEGNAPSVHIHMCVSVPPKYSVTMTIGYLKDKSAILIIEMEKRYGKWFWV